MQHYDPSHDGAWSVPAFRGLLAFVVIEVAAVAGLAMHLWS